MTHHHFNGLTPEEHEALSLLMEECGEVIQTIGKVMRHGLDSCHPISMRTNREDLAKEVGDVLCAIRILRRDKVVEQKLINSAINAKIRKFLDHPTLLHHVDPL